MTAPDRLLAWCAGASCGYIFGWLAGSAVRDRAEARRLGRAGTGASATVRRSGGRTGSQAVEGRPGREAALSDAQRITACDVLDIEPDIVCGHCGGFGCDECAEDPS